MDTGENLETSGDAKDELIPVKESTESAAVIDTNKPGTPLASLIDQPANNSSSFLSSTSLADQSNASADSTVPSSEKPPLEPSAENEKPSEVISSSDERSSELVFKEAPLEPSPVDKASEQISNERPSEPNPDEVVTVKRKEDDKSSMYKALAIKLKKELVKIRDKLQKVEEDYSTECNALKSQVAILEESLNTEKQARASSEATLEAKNKNLKSQLHDTETDLQSLQTEFEEYKARASKILQQNNPMLQSCSIKSFETERYKNLKELNDEQKKQIANLSSQLSSALDRSKEHEESSRLLKEQLEVNLARLESFKTIDNKCELLLRENENLKLVLKQFRTKLREPSGFVPDSSVQNCCNDSNIGENVTKTKATHDDGNTHGNNAIQITAQRSERSTQIDRSPSIDDRLEDNLTRLSPSASVKDDSQTNSSSSFDGSTSGYVHIKPTAFEIISRSSVLEDAQNQIDNLTKAYLDSESTNSLLSEQVRALKEEIRRLQRGTERLDLAENLEYLKNVVFKFLSLDSGQAEQKQRLVPVLSTVLKLSPEETAKLNSLAIIDKPSMASSFFKL